MGNTSVAGYSSPKTRSRISGLGVPKMIDSDDDAAPNAQVVKLLRRLGCYAFPVLYWLVCVELLRSASPLSFDGGGPLPTFYWGVPPLPDLETYERNRTLSDWIYAIPYFVAAFLMALVGARVAPLLATRLLTARAQLFWKTTGLAFALFLLLAVVSDACTVLKAWRAPLIVLHLDPVSLWLTAKIFVAASLLSGLGTKVSP